MERRKSKAQMYDKGEEAKLLAKVPEGTWHIGRMGSSEAGKEPMGIKE